MYITKILIIITLLLGFSYLSITTPSKSAKSSVEAKEMLTLSLTIDRQLTAYAKNNNGQFPSSLEKLDVASTEAEKFTYTNKGFSYALIYKVGAETKHSPNSNIPFKS